MLELSLRQALQLGHNHIGTEHVLLGLIREGEGVAAQVLIGCGVHLEVVRQNVIMLLTESGGVRSETPPHKSSSSAEPQHQLRSDLNTCSFCGRRLLDAQTMVTGYRGATCASCIRRASRAVSAAVHRAFAPHVAVADRSHAIEAGGDPLPLDYLPSVCFRDHSHPACEGIHDCRVGAALAVE